MKVMKLNSTWMKLNPQLADSTELNIKAPQSPFPSALTSMSGLTGQLANPGSGQSPNGKCTLEGSDESPSWPVRELLPWMKPSWWRKDGWLSWSRDHQGQAGFCRKAAYEMGHFTSARCRSTERCNNDDGNETNDDDNDKFKKQSLSLTVGRGMRRRGSF